MLAAIDIHKAVFQTAVLDPGGGEIAEERFKASREELAAWIEKWDGQLDVVAIEVTTGWRWVTRELQARGIEVRLTDPGQASALQGNRKRPKTDRLDARWLVMLLARELLPDAWAPPEDIQYLRDKTGVDAGSILTPLRRLKFDPLGALAEASGWFLTLA